MKKEEALINFIEMIQNSWTYARMTKEEKTRLLELLNHPCIVDSLKGTFIQRWASLQAIYHAFLQGLGYDNFNWREGEARD